MIPPLLWSRRPAHWVCSIAVLLLLGGCTDDRPNVFLITLDTTRADHLGCYGNADIETPSFDALAAAGIRYDSAFTPVPITLPAHTSILTGTYPVYHGVRENAGFYVPSSARTLAEILLEEGYDTAAFVGAFPLDSQTGIDQGFEVYDDNYPSSLDKTTHPQLRRFFDERPAADVSRAALAWLDRRQGDGPFFLWTHYFDPHQPLLPPSPYRERYPDSPYDAEIASTDEAVGRILARLERDGELDNTLVILTADHGEGLGEHGEATHALLLYSSTLRVPLILRGPGLDAGTTVSAPVSTVDIFPTVLQQLGLEIAPEVQGQALPQSDQEAPEQREIYAETMLGRLIYGWSPLERLTADHMMLIRGPSDTRLYDRAVDPDELNNLGPSRPDERDHLTDRMAQTKDLLAWEGRRFSRGEDAAPGDAAELQAALARLASLGYIGAGAAAATMDDEIDPDRPDPLQMMEVFRLHNEGTALVESKRFDGALAVLLRAEQLDPGNPAVLQALAQAHQGRGDGDASEQVLDRLLAINPEDVRTLLLLSQHNANSGQLEEATGAMEAALAIEPSNLTTRLLLAQMLEDLGNLEDSEANYREILAQDPDYVRALNGLATLLYRQGDTSEAITLLESALEKQPFYAPAWLNLGVIQWGQGNAERALELSERALELRPGYPQAETLRARSLAQIGE